MCNTCGCRGAEDFEAEGGFSYSELRKVVRKLKDEGKISIGLSNPSYGGYVGYTSGPYGCGNNCSQVLLNIGYYSYGAKTKTPSAWIETVKAQIGDDKELMNDFNYGLSDGEYAIEDGSYSSYEYTDGLYYPSGERATIELDSGNVHCSAYYAGYMIGNAKHDIPVIEAALKAQRDFGAESKFDELSDEIAEQYEKKGMSKEEAEKIGKATAYKVGVAKYGKRGMERKAKAGMKKKKMNAEDLSVKESAKIGFGFGAGILGFQIALLAGATLVGAFMSRGE